MSERLKYERFFWFHGRVKSEGYPNSTHLVEAFEISPRTAQRDIEFMRDRLNAPLVFDRARRGYRYNDSFYEMPGHWISETNVLSLALAIRLASTIPDPTLKDDLCRLLDRIPIGIGDESTSCLDRLSARISVKNIEYSQVDRDIFRQSVEALFAGNSLHIVYHSPHTGTTTERTIHPLHLMHYMGSWHFIAWCGSRMELRNFALSRIRQITPCTEKLVLPDNLPDMKEYTRQHFGIMQGDNATEVGLCFSSKIAPWVSEQVWHPKQRLTHNPDGSLTLHFPVADFRELTKTILSHGADIEVLTPPELKTFVKEEIDRMTKIYR